RRAKAIPSSDATTPLPPYTGQQVIPIFMRRRRAMKPWKQTAGRECDGLVLGCKAQKLASMDHVAQRSRVRSADPAGAQRPSHSFREDRDAAGPIAALLSVKTGRRFTMISEKHRLI